MFNQDNGRVLFEKNADAQLPVASLTKLMSALVIMRANLPMNEAFTVQSEEAIIFRPPLSRASVLG